MTPLHKPVTRRTADPCPSVRRRLCVTLAPGDVIEFREEGRRKRYIAPLAWVFVQVAKRNAMIEAQAKREARKNKNRSAAL